MGWKGMHEDMGEGIKINLRFGIWLKHNLRDLGKGSMKLCQKYSLFIRYLLRKGLKV